MDEPVDEEKEEVAEPQSCSEIQVEIVTEEEMAFIEAAISSASTLIARSSPSHLQRHARNLKRSVSLSLHRTASSEATNGIGEEIEDLGGVHPLTMRKKKKCGGGGIGGLPSLYHQHRRRRGLSVTDMTTSEWCEKQMEFILHGKPKKTDAMKAGSARHAELEAEVMKRVELSINSVEEFWAVKFLNFIVGANQLLFEGLTRELPVVGLVEGVWMSGVIDEIRMPVTGVNQNPLLIDIKTRYRATLPSEAQKRNSRFQLMCYKYLWDKMIANNFPLDDFFNYFGLDPGYKFSEDLKQHISFSAGDVETLQEFMMYFRNMCCLLPPSSEQLLLRYEFQGDRSSLGECQFEYDDIWFKSQTLLCLQFWLGERQAGYVSDKERWKCGFCSFSTKCPGMNSSFSPAEDEPPKDISG